MTALGEFALFASLGVTSAGLFFGPIGKAIARRITAAPADTAPPADTAAETPAADAPTGGA